MLEIFVAFGLIFAFILGFNFPKNTGWGIILLVPVLYPTFFTLIPSSLMPLTTNRFGLVAVMGIIASNKYSFKFWELYSIKLTKITLLFLILLFLWSIFNNPFKILLSYISDIIFGILIGYTLINNENDLKKLLTIFSWQSALFGLFILFEYFTDFNINVYLTGTAPNIDIQEALQIKGINEFSRSGYIRAMGIDGNAVQTGYRLAFLFPLTILYASIGKFYRLIPLILISVGLILVQTRAALIVIIVSSVYIYFRLTLIKMTKKLMLFFAKLAVIVFSSFVFLFFFMPTIINVGTSLYNTAVSDDSEESLKNDNRSDFIYVAIDKFIEKPILGYGSPVYVYYEVMESMDLPSPLIYLLSGGVILGSLYLLILLMLPFGIFKLSKQNNFNSASKVFYIFSGGALLSGVLVLFFNWQENHLLIMFLYYFAIQKVYLNQKKLL